MTVTSTSTKHSPAAYIGRFAPSPTGPLHFGSLLAALASYLDARHHNGQWLVRIEDLDPPREQAGAADAILRCLDLYGLHWDQKVRYQSKRSAAYKDALDTLIDGNHAFACQCSRKQLLDGRHSGGPQPQCIPMAGGDFAWRLRCPDNNIAWLDRLQGPQRWHGRHQLDDAVLKRRDGLWAYQLAVVVDDADQHITHIVRGLDLLSSTPYQRLLQQMLELPEPETAHIPIAVESNGQKLSKQNKALAIDPANNQEEISTHLLLALEWLKQDLGESKAALKHATSDEILTLAVECWDDAPLQGIASAPAPRCFQREMT